jgi:hypothetical protein
VNAPACFGREGAEAHRVTFLEPFLTFGAGREYLALPPEVVDDPDEARAWVERAAAYVRTLPAKVPKPRTTRASSYGGRLSPRPSIAVGRTASAPR